MSRAPRKSASPSFGTPRAKARFLQDEVLATVMKKCADPALD
jgi:hypothetical protein